jgi:hypothetical protein
VILRMWEARVEPGRLPDALDWLRQVVVPAALGAGALRCELSASDGPPARAVLVTRFPGPPGWVEPAAPPGLLARADAWAFALVGEWPAGAPIDAPDPPD